MYSTGISLALYIYKIKYFLLDNHVQLWFQLTSNCKLLQYCNIISTSKCYNFETELWATMVITVTGDINKLNESSE